MWLHLHYSFMGYRILHTQGYTQVYHFLITKFTGVDAFSIGYLRYRLTGAS
jgi:hypothetical protein